MSWRVFAHFAENYLGLELEDHTTDTPITTTSLPSSMPSSVSLSFSLTLAVMSGYTSQRNTSSRRSKRRGRLLCYAPQVNPIDFENAEESQRTVAYLEHLAHKLPISRLQRDLPQTLPSSTIWVCPSPIPSSRSTLSSRAWISFFSMNRLFYPSSMMHFPVFKALQTILRREGYPNPYETLKALTHYQ